MQVLFVLSALVAVAVAAPSAIIAGVGPIASASLVQGPVATLAGSSGTIVANTGSISTAPHGAAAAVVAAPSVVVGPSHAGLIAPGVLGVPNVWNHGLVAGHGVWGHNGYVAGNGVWGHNGLVAGHGVWGHNGLILG